MTAPVQHPHDPMPEALWSLGCLFVLKGRSDELEVIDAIVPPGYSPPLHRHDFGAESFYVIEGRARFVYGDREEVLGPGGFARVPPDLAEIVARHGGKVLGPPLNRPGLRLER